LKPAKKKVGGMKKPATRARAMSKAKPAAGKPAVGGGQGRLSGSRASYVRRRRNS